MHNVLLQVVDPEFGYLEPVHVAEGKIPLRLAIDLINAYKDDSEANSALVLSEKYKLDLQITYHILEHFTPFNLRLPKPEDVPAETALPLLKERSIKQTQKRLESAQKIIDDYEDKSKAKT